MTDQRIPPRPWRLSFYGRDEGDDRHFCDGVEDADGDPIISRPPGGYPDTLTCEHIVRLVNAHDDVVAALEAAERALRDHCLSEACAECDAHDAARAALAKLRP